MDKDAMIKDVEWLGKFVAFHSIGEYSIVEYKPKVYDDISPKIPTEHEIESMFSIFINGRSCSRSFNTLDEAIVGCIARKHDGANTKADQYFIKAIKN